MARVEIVPIRSIPVRIRLHRGEVVAVLFAPRAFRAFRKAATFRPVQYGAPIDPGSMFLAIENDPHTKKASALHVGSWLGAPVYLDVRGAFVERHSNGKEEA